MLFRLGEFEIDGEGFELRRGAERVALQPKVLRMLLLLVQNRGRAMSKDEILSALWPRESVGETSLTTVVRNARLALGDSGDLQRSIRTVRGFGYRFVAPVQEIAADETPQAPIAAREPFIGREHALAVLESLLEESRAGCNRTVLLIGEAGIGKTRTSEELAARARARGADVLTGRCLETEGAPVFWPFIQVLRGFGALRDRQSLAAQLGPAAPELAQLVPELRVRLGAWTPPPALDAAQARFRLFDGFAGALERAARVRPLVLILDDLHHADEPSLQLLHFLTREDRGARLLVLGTQRDTASDPFRAQLLAELARAPAARSLHLEGLSADEVARFVELRIGRPLAPVWVARLHEKTGGNPFFLTQLVRLLEANGDLARVAGDGPLEVALPQSVREAIRRQLGGLSSRCLEVLEAASVIGRDFELAALAAAVGSRADAALAVLGEAIAEGIVAEAPQRVARYRFTHALVRDALYGDLTSVRRIDLHRKVSAALESIHAADSEPHLEALAHHFLQAAATGVADRAVFYSARAGDRAAALLAHEEAARHYERALEAMALLPPDERRHGELLVALGEAEMRAGEVQIRGEPSPKARTTLRRAGDLARRIGASDLLARAALAFGGTVGGMRFGILDPDLVQLLEEALAALGAGDGALRVRVMGRLAMALYWSDARARRDALSLEAILLARRLGNASALAYALYSRRTALWGADGAEERLACADEIVDLAQRAGQRELEIAGRQGRIADCLELGDLARADREFAQYAALAEELRVPQYLWWATTYRGMRALLEGRFEEGERLAQQAMALGQSGQSEDAVQALGAQLFTMRREQGRLAELEPLLRGFLERFPTVPGWRTGLAYLYAELRRPADTREHFEVLAAHDFEDLPRDQNWLPAIASLTEACAALGDVARAERLYALLLPYRRRIILLGFANGCFGSAERYLGLLAETSGRVEAALDHFEAAREIHARLGARPWVARTDYDIARLLARRSQRDDRARSAALVAGVLESAAELGMASLALRVRELDHVLHGVVPLRPRLRS
jgi:DNA-binding winged helix-turn-helix (wHTH) protein/tetratricopeptide (TPR) repeat protein